MSNSLQIAEKHCVFQSDDRWFGMTALAVRGIVPRPELTPSPLSDPIMKGIGHIQNEFLPVVSMRALTQIQYDTNPEFERQLMILQGPQGTWGLLIDQASALAELESSISTYSNQDDNWAKVTLGSASWQSEFLEILDPTALFEYAETLVNGFWTNSSSNSQTLAH